MSEDEQINITKVKTTYTFNEAIEYMKQKDKRPTKICEPYARWVDVRTGEEFFIGYNL